MTTAKAVVEYVAGERICDLAPALVAILDNRGPADENDLCTFDISHLSADVAAPLWRAIMRTEAALLLRDVDQVTAKEHESRTQAERRQDALTEVLRQLMEPILANIAR